MLKANVVSNKLYTNKEKGTQFRMIKGLVLDNLVSLTIPDGSALDPDKIMSGSQVFIVIEPARALNTYQFTIIDVAE